ncbi:MAG: hypothetical protein E7292_09230 [Lachnospiraceae bacterium]|nr:hypothetical protein [Lachnospiraceae bacterium]
MRKIDFYILYFFLVSFAGWLWEVGLYLVTEQAFINRGAFYGPYLPIYGVGGVLLWIVLQRFYHRKTVTFLLAMVLCSVLEYFTGAFLEWKWGMRWWDYRGQFMNLNGHICLICSVGFGLGGTLLNCYLMPFYMRLYHKVSSKWRKILCGVLSVIFIVDLVWCLVSPNTGENITTMKNDVSLAIHNPFDK